MRTKAKAISYRSLLWKLFIIFSLEKSSAWLSHLPAASVSIKTPKQFYTSKRFAFLPWFGDASTNKTEDENNIEEEQSQPPANLVNVATVMEGLKNAKKIGERTNNVLQDLSNILIEGSAAEGKVKVTYTANQKPMGVQIDPEYFQSLKGDKEGSNELSLAMTQAMEEAHAKSAVKMEEKMKTLYADLGFEN